MKRSVMLCGAIALTLVLTTGALAAKRFLITSSAQVAPGVLTGKDIKDGSLSASVLSSAAKAALRGTPGPAGVQGPVGPAGPVGVAGPRGFTGADGFDGLDGVDGVDGVDGAQGVKGDVGPQGPQGEVGPRGAAGTAAVTIHTQAYALAAGVEQSITASCDAGQLAVSGGFVSNGLVFDLGSRPTPADDGWTMFLVDTEQVPRAGTVFVSCLG